MYHLLEADTPRFKFEGQLGSGSFGTVYKAYDLNKSIFVAIKRTVKLGYLVSREYMILTEVADCEFCVKLLDIFYTVNTQGLCIQHLVFEYLPDNLSRYIKFRYKNFQPLSHKEIAYIMKQLLKGLDFLHNKGIMHRDLKPENIIIDSQNLRVKICDFGSAKKHKDNKNTPYIVSRYYRAPELIFCCEDYNTSIDIWSAGCIFIELFTGVPVFTGKTEGDQFIKQASVLGPPTVNDLHKLAKHNKIKGNSLLNALLIKKHGSFIEFFKRCSNPQAAADLASCMLMFDPDNRPNARACLDHNFFDICL